VRKKITRSWVAIERGGSHLGQGGGKTVLIVKTYSGVKKYPGKT